MLARALLSPTSRVLELGARFGTSSCAIAKAQNNSGMLLSVEPDPSVQKLLRHNRWRNQCNFAIVNGTVGLRTPMRVVPLFSYATHTRRANLSRGDAAVPNLPITAVEALLGWSIDTLFIDCEGCIEQLLAYRGAKIEDTPLSRIASGQIGLSSDGLALLEQVTLIILEEDLLPRAQYHRWWKVLARYGFRRIWHIADSFNQSWSSRLVHSAWAKMHPNGTTTREWPSCEAFRSREGIEPHALRCLLAWPL